MAAQRLDLALGTCPIYERALVRRGSVKADGVRRRGHSGCKDTTAAAPAEVRVPGADNEPALSTRSKASSGRLTERSTATLPSSCQDCQSLGVPWSLNCPHVRGGFTHQHSTSTNDRSCLNFLGAQVGTGRVGGELPRPGPRTLAGQLAPEQGKAKIAKTAEPTVALSATFTYRRHSGPAGISYEAAWALFPGLAVVNQEAVFGGRTRTTARWLRDAIVGRPIADIARQSNRRPEDVQRAINSIARRICRNELPLRFRDDRVEAADDR